MARRVLRVSRVQGSKGFQGFIRVSGSLNLKRSTLLQAGF